MTRIIADPYILGGKPIIGNTRISVEHVLGLLSHGMTHSEIVEDHPELTIEDINEVLRYALKALQNEVVIEVRSSVQAE